MDMATSMATKQFSVEEAISEPLFRYIPDRTTIQRLLTRCSNMKDDLAEDLGELGLYESAGDGPPASGAQEGTIQSTI